MSKKAAKKKITKAKKAPTVANAKQAFAQKFEDINRVVKSGDLVSLASEKREDVEREVRRLAEEVIGSVKEIELLSRKVNLSGVFNRVRKNLGNIVEQIGDNDLVQKAKLTLGQTKKELLGVLSIPTQDEVGKLEKKIVSLEKRLSNLTRKAA